MDTSEIYIKMCEVAEEIQGACPIDFKGYKPLFNGITYDENAGDVFYYRGQRKVWLPRQDQLQEMVEIKDKLRSPLHILFFAFRAFVQNGDEDAWWDFRDEYKSFEQLWLTFVMQEKYEKKWDGEAWIKQ